MKNTKKVPAKIEKLIFQESNSKCSFCGENDVSSLEIHHIRSRAENGSNEPENLILCCANCHSKITAGVISIHEVYKIKISLKNKSFENHEEQSEFSTSNVLVFPKRKKASSNTIQFERSVNRGLVANNLFIGNINKNIKLSPPAGIIATDSNKLSYVKYLIDRYNQFKKADRTIADFRYAIIYSSIKNKFKCKWDFIPLNRFFEAIDFLQHKIDNTILGKYRCKQNQRNYSTYEEYLNGYRLNVKF